MITPASRLGDVQEYYFSRKLREIAAMKAAGKEVLNLGIGSPDLPPAPEVIEQLATSAAKPDNHAYQSYVGIPALREAFAKWYDQWFNTTLNPDSEILPLIGSKEGIMHVAMTFLEAGDVVLVPNPGYPAYRAVSSLTGATIQEYLLSEETDWLPDFDALEQTDLSAVKLMWVNYPHMPSGTQAPEGFFEQLVAFATRHNILVVNDNPYGFILNEAQRSILSVPGAREVALELNSLSKSHNMAGWRIGMLAGHSTYIQAVLRFKSNMDSGMFKPMQEAAVLALAQPESWYKDLNEVYRERRKLVFALMDALGCTYDENQTGMFVWARIPDQWADGYALCDEVLEKSYVFITPGGIFGSQGNRYIRISLCSRAVLYEEAIQRVEKQFQLMKV